jgi:hypothetical protein
MSNSTSAIGALFLVPIAIAFCAAFLALKTVGLFQHIYKFLHPYWTKFTHTLARGETRRARKIRKSNLRTFRTYGDSWCDLESVASNQDSYSKFIGQSLRKSPRSRYSARTWDKDDVFGPDLQQIWHPSRSTRLRWSFTNPRSPNLSRFESSNVARRSPGSHTLGVHFENVALLAPPAKAKVALRSG